MVKLFVLAVLVAILASLASALIYLVRDKGASARTVRALTVRVGLSVALFFLLLAAYWLGFIEPHGLYPAAPGS